MKLLTFNNKLDRDYFCLNGHAKNRVFIFVFHKHASHHSESFRMDDL